MPSNAQWGGRASEENIIFSDDQIVWVSRRGLRLGIVWVWGIVACVLLGGFVSPALSQPTYPAGPFSLVWSPDGSLIAGTGDRFLRIWDTATGALLMDFSPSMQTYVVDASWSPDSTRLATASDDQVVRIWNIKDANHTPGEILATIIPNPNPNTVLSFVSSVAWHPNGQLLAIGSTDGGYTLQIWDATTYQPVKQFRTGWITHLTWLPDSHRNILMVTNEMADATIFSIDAPEVQGNVPIGRYVAAEAADWNSDGSKIAVGYEDGTIYVWDEVTNSLVVILSTQSAAPIRNLDWSFDDRKIISSDSNGIVRIWNSTSGEILQEIPARTLAVAFSPINDAWAHGGRDGNIVLLPSQD